MERVLGNSLIDDETTFNVSEVQAMYEHLKILTTLLFTMEQGRVSSSII